MPEDPHDPEDLRRFAQQGRGIREVLQAVSKGAEFSLKVGAEYSSVRQRVCVW
jgi:hypothetical protein